MWPFRRKKKKADRMLENVVVGLVIGGAIASIIGKTMLDKKDDEGDKGTKSHKEK
jgi:hypothetical protein